MELAGLTLAWEKSDLLSLIRLSIDLLCRCSFVDELRRWLGFFTNFPSNLKKSMLLLLALNLPVFPGSLKLF